MKLDQDIRAMGLAARGQELMRLRNLLRSHKNKRDNARCWHNDEQLYARVLPEGSSGAGSMTLPETVLLRNCKRYIRGQQCVSRGCKKNHSQS
jgi:hypothetical protein